MIYNALNELVCTLGDSASCYKVDDIKWAVIKHIPLSGESKFIVLKENHSTDELNEFLNKLDFNYDNDYGSQEVYGYVVFNDGNWLERQEYDGSEWWEYQREPSFDCIFETLKEFGE